MKPNIIFVLLDGARWDRLHTSPEFLELKKHGTLFNNVTTALPYTAGALNVIFSGLFGKENGVDGYYKVLKLKDSVKILPEILQENGYYTSRALINDKLLSPRGYDFRQSFNEYTQDLNVKHPEFINETLKKANDKPAFIFLQFTRIHTITVSEVLKKYEWDDQEFYDQGEENLAKFDMVFREAGIYSKKIKETIDNSDRSENTILIFFTDHGTGIGERFGERNYGSFTYEETIRTFYHFIGPNIMKNKSCDQLLSTIDLFPTLLDLCDIKFNGNRPGKSFAMYLTGKENEVLSRPFTFSETGALHGPFPSPEISNVFCIKTSQHKLIYLKTPNDWKFFDLKNDPTEKKSLYGTGMNLEKELQEKLLEWINR